MLVTYLIGTAIFLAWTCHLALREKQVIIPKRVVLGLSFGWPLVLMALAARFGWHKVKAEAQRRRNLANT